MVNTLDNTVVSDTSLVGVSETVKKHFIHPVNNPVYWLESPSFTPPLDVDIERCQKEIDSIIGTTRDNKSIFKLVWNGDRRYWLEYFMEWNSIGQPTAPAFKRPHVRYKAFRDQNKKLIRDVFPPRWLLFARIEPEQYFDTWKHDSYFFAPEINGFKQIRPDTPPEDFYIWHATIAKHTGFCCTRAEKADRRCYGEYAPPQHVYNALGEAKIAAEQSGRETNPFASIDADFIRDIQEENTGYNEEIAQLEIDAQIYTENPLALIGLAGIVAGYTAKQAETTVKEYFDRQLDETSRLIK